MQNINEVFSELDRRIDFLKNFPTVLNFYSHLKRDFNITSIERNIFRFEKEAVQRIDIALKELNELEAKGISLITTNHEEYFNDENDYRIQLTKEELIADHARRRTEGYVYLKEEIAFYITRLCVLKASLQKEGFEEDKKKYTISVGEGFKFPDLKKLNHEAQLILSAEQSALLFQYLMDSHIIYTYDAKAICKIISILTGYSDEFLRQKVFGNLNGIKNKVPQKASRAITLPIFRTSWVVS
jgi:hypothetical protein